MKSDPKKSEGARAERKAIRAKLARMYKEATQGKGAFLCTACIEDLQEWASGRQKRYDKAEGGLGKK